MTLIYDDPPNKTPALKKYITINFTHLTKQVCIFYLPVPISVTLSICTARTLTFLKHTATNPILFTAPDIRHF